jgi:hypothetical protein
MKEALHSSNHVKFGAAEDSTGFVDNFVDKRILISGNQSLNSWKALEPGKYANLFLFKINHLEKPP